MRSFVKIKSSRNAEITLSFTDLCKSCPISSQICLFNAIRENKVIEKKIGFTVARVEAYLGVKKRFCVSMLNWSLCFRFEPVHDKLRSKRRLRAA